MVSKDNLAEAATAGTIVVNVPPKPKFELLLSVFLLTASLLLVISEFSNYAEVERKNEK